MNKAPCCQAPCFPLPKARPCPPPVPCAACGCDPCACRPPCPPACPPPCPPKPDCGCGRRSRYLVERIVGFGSCHERCVNESLCLTRIPRAAIPPYTLVYVSACAQTPVIEELPPCACRTLNLNVTVPLDCVFLDANQNRFESVVTLSRTVCLRLDCARDECWRHRISARACARLLRNVSSGADACFCAPLELLIEGFVTATCPVGGPIEPCCPADNRPLYPPPICR